MAWRQFKYDARRKKGAAKWHFWAYPETTKIGEEDIVAMRADPNDRNRSILVTRHDPGDVLIERRLTTNVLPNFT